MMLRAAACIIAFGALSLTPLPGAGYAQESEDSLRAAHAQFLEDEAYQHERPVREETPDEPEEVRERRESSGFFKWLGELLSGLGPLFQILLYGVVAVIVGALVYFIFGEALNIRKGPILRRKVKDDDVQDDVAIPVAKPEAQAAKTLLEEADALAASGQYAEAIHLLLFRSIQDIQTRRHGLVRRALTAREIGHIKALPDRPRAALNAIIALVERSFFGGRPVGEPDWQSARASYETFAFGEGWS